MIADGGYLVGDGSWELRIFVTDLQLDRTLRVKGDLHIGGVMLRLVEDLDIANDWSDHALWWPDKNEWLTRTRSTLDQCGVQADALLHFTPMHKTLRVQLPDLMFRDMRVDFSCKTFSAVVNVCRELGIRHPEELSFCRPLTPECLKANRRGSFHRTPRCEGNKSLSNSHTSTSLDSTHPGNDHVKQNGSIGKPSPGSGRVTPNNLNSSNVGTPVATATWRSNYHFSNGTMNGSYSPASMNSMSSADGMNGVDQLLINSPPIGMQTRQNVPKPKSLLEKARLNVAWLDSSLSIMEQNVREFDTLVLKFKYYSFFDLNPKYDAVRINQIYEQAKWALLNEENDCTEEEMMMFAALQLQINLQAQVEQPSPEDDDIDAALTDLQITLEGSSVVSTPGDIMQVPELADYLRFLKPKRFTLKGFKRFFFTFKDTQLRAYKSKDDVGSEPQYDFNLKAGCEVTPDVNLTQNKYGIKLEVPGPEGMSEMWIRCDSEQQYAKWMAACRLATKGRTMADSSYENEVKSISSLLSLQHPAPMPAINPASLDIQAEDYVAPRFIKKAKGRQISTRILEAHTNVKDLNLVDAKLSYIRAWQALPDYGITLFAVRFVGHKKDELLGVASNRLMRMELNSGDHLKTWRYNTMKAWNVNWEIKQVIVQFEEGEVRFACLTADCKIVHEYIGGYIFLSTRSKDQNQTLNEELFHKLTGGWI